MVEEGAPPESFLRDQPSQRTSLIETKTRESHSAALRSSRALTRSTRDLHRGVGTWNRCISAAADTHIAHSLRWVRSLDRTLYFEIPLLIPLVLTR